MTYGEKKSTTIDTGQQVQGFRADRLRALRAEKGVELREVATALGVHRAALSKWEHGKARQQAKNMSKLAAYYGISVEDLYGTDSSNTSSDLQHDGGSAKVAAELLGEIIRPINMALEQLSARVSENAESIQRAYGGFTPHLEQFHKALGSMSDRLEAVERRVTALEQRSAWRVESKERKKR